MFLHTPVCGKKEGIRETVCISFDSMAWEHGNTAGLKHRSASYARMAEIRFPAGFYNEL